MQWKRCAASCRLGGTALVTRTLGKQEHPGVHFCQLPFPLLPSLPSRGAGSKAQPAAACFTLHPPGWAAAAALLYFGWFAAGTNTAVPTLQGKSSEHTEAIGFLFPSFYWFKAIPECTGLGKSLCALGGRQWELVQGPRGDFHLLGYPGLLWLQVSPACASAPQARLQAGKGSDQTSPTPL